MIGWQLRLILIGLLAATLTGAVLHVKRVTRERDAYKAEARQAQADYTALRDAYAHERKLAKDASDDYEKRLQDLSAAAAATPVRSVRLCRSPTGYVPATAESAFGTGTPDPAGRAGEAGRDSEAGAEIGDALYALADEWDRRAAQCNALIRWVESR